VYLLFLFYLRNDAEGSATNSSINIQSDAYHGVTARLDYVMSDERIVRKKKKVLLVEPLFHPVGSYAR
jgi:hypothetical protein